MNDFSQERIPQSAKALRVPALSVSLQARLYQRLQDGETKLERLRGDEPAVKVVRVMHKLVNDGLAERVADDEWALRVPDRNVGAETIIRESNRARALTYAWKTRGADWWLVRELACAALPRVHMAEAVRVVEACVRDGSLEGTPRGGHVRFAGDRSEVESVAPPSKPIDTRPLLIPRHPGIGGEKSAKPEEKSWAEQGEDVETNESIAHGNRISAARRALNWSQQQLATAAGLGDSGVSAVGRLEVGRPIRPQTQIAIERALFSRPSGSPEPEKAARKKYNKRAKAPAARVEPVAETPAEVAVEPTVPEAAIEPPIEPPISETVRLPIYRESCAKCSGIFRFAWDPGATLMEVPCPDCEHLCVFLLGDMDDPVAHDADFGGPRLTLPEPELVVSAGNVVFVVDGQDPPESHISAAVPTADPIAESIAEADKALAFELIELREIVKTMHETFDAIGVEDGRARDRLCYLRGAICGLRAVGIRSGPT